MAEHERPAQDEKQSRRDADMTVTQAPPSRQALTLTQGAAAQSDQGVPSANADEPDDLSDLLDLTVTAPPKTPVEQATVTTPHHGGIPSNEATLSAAHHPHAAPAKHAVTFTKRGTISDPTLTHSLHAPSAELTDKVNWEVGDVIEGRFEVMDVIGQGGMGIVYRVNHREWKLEMGSRCR